MDTMPYIVPVVRNMFINTADQNYILARYAYFNQLHIDFFWLSLHALEKYFKAILLLNGKPANDPKHDLLGLHDVVIALRPCPELEQFIDPKIEGLYWRDSTVSSFLERLNVYGHSSNRYSTYGYTARLDDLVKVDQLVWSTRRYCRPLQYVLSGCEGDTTINEVDELKTNSRRWKLFSSSPVESLIESGVSNELKTTFLRFNVPFAPDIEHKLSNWQVAALNPPLLEHFEILESSNADQDTKEISANVLLWALENLFFVKKDKSEIANALSRYKKST